jgi:23S rRNA (guanosine2251-2'-O)-methyltransferase
MKRLVLIAHNVRSCLNVGSLLRTADGLGLEHVYLTGYTPYPLVDGDTRLPHLARQIANRINKSALGAGGMVAWSHETEVEKVISRLRDSGYQIIALEQTEQSVPLDQFQSSKPIALIVGREVEGIETKVLAQCDQAIEIPMRGQKESFNVSVAAAIALYELYLAR